MIMTDTNQIEALRAEVASLKATVAALTAVPVARSFDDSTLVARIEAIEAKTANSRQRIDPLIDESPELRERVKPARSRDAGNTMLSKEFAGGILIMRGRTRRSGSARPRRATSSSTRSTPIRPMPTSKATRDST